MKMPCICLAFFCSDTSDRVRVLDPNGNFIRRSCFLSGAKSGANHDRHFRVANTEWPKYVRARNVVFVARKPWFFARNAEYSGNVFVHEHRVADVAPNTEGGPQLFRVQTKKKRQVLRTNASTNEYSVIFTFFFECELKSKSCSWKSPFPRPNAHAQGRHTSESSSAASPARARHTAAAASPTTTR